MDDIARAAEDVLLTHPHPALRLGELLEQLAGTVRYRLTPERLRAVLEADPSRFRVLEAWHRRWPAALGGIGDAERLEPWVVCVSERRPPDGPPAPGAAGKLRESVRWLGRSTDTRSRMAVGRWYALALSERDARKVVSRKAGEGPPQETAERRAS